MLPVIELFNIRISTYALAALAGCALCLAVLLKNAKRYAGLAKSDAVLLFLSAILGGLIGAKLLYIVVDLDAIIQRGTLLKSLTGGGFVFYGGLFGGMIAAYFYCCINKLDFFAFADVFCAPVCFGHAVGRIGCFLAGCCYGARTSSGLGVVYPEEGIPPAGVKLLPVQLMEAAFLLILAIALLFIMKRKKRLLPCAVYLIAYGAWRFVIEFLRDDPRGSVGVLSASQFISIFAVILGIIAARMSIKYAKEAKANAEVK